MRRFGERGSMEWDFNESNVTGTMRKKRRDSVREEARRTSGERLDGFLLAEQSSGKAGYRFWKFQ